ncbi:MATE family efflux transporter [Derxia gummosa]|uniref:MATE family efflux transporter n=1 Tax=Derxia gummosa DSM 723 TaxID=1121388 RepID=A0A8B6X6M1_9BURK|nr:MATE family efflux transporter [Derxia gummosa]
MTTSSATSDTAAPRADTPTHREIVALAVPLILSSLTQPLLSAVDTALAGHMRDATSLGAVTLGAQAFNLVFWGFVFLRMGTAALTAQARGARDSRAESDLLMRALGLAVGAGALLVLLRAPLLGLLADLFDAQGALRARAFDYCGARIWSLPFGLANYVILGWLLGARRAMTGLALQLLVNAVNLAVALALVLGFDAGVAGLGAATAVADATGCIAGLVLLARAGLLRLPGAALRDAAAWRALVAMNGTLLVRTAALLAVFSAFTRHGAGQGEVILAANGVLMSVATFVTYGIDGFANAAQTLVGTAIGARDPAQARRAVLRPLLWAGLLALPCVVALWLAGPPLIDAMTDLPEVRAAARRHLLWLALWPVAAVGAFMFDGIYIGAVLLRELMWAVLGAAVLFFVAVGPAMAVLGNHGLWLVLDLFLLLRGAVLGGWLRRVVAKAG